MAVTFVNSSVLYAGSTTSLVLPIPSGVVTGTYMVAIVYASAVNTMTPPSGWTIQGSQVNNAFYECCLVADRIAGGSEPSTYTFTADISSPMLGAIMAYSGAGGMDGLPQINVSSTFTTSINILAATASATNDTWVVGIGLFDGTTITTPAGMTLRGGNGSGNARTIAVYDKASMASGSTGTNSATAGTGTRATTVSLLAAPVSPSATSTILLGPLTLTTLSTLLPTPTYARITTIDRQRTSL